jgi:hypothetical protein
VKRRRTASSSSYAPASAAPCWRPAPRGGARAGAADLRAVGGADDDDAALPAAVGRAASGAEPVKVHQELCLEPP